MQHAAEMHTAMPTRPVVVVCVVLRYVLLLLQLAYLILPQILIHDPPYI